MGEFSPLKFARIVKGFSQYTVEAETGIRQSVLSLYERGLRTPSQTEKEKLAALYKFSVHTLFPESNEAKEAEGSGSESC